MDDPFFLCRYVVEKDVKNNVVFVSRNYYSLDKKRRTFSVGSLNWFGSSGPTNSEQLKCKVSEYTVA
jgi:tRNA-specific 2-thiouridylase